MKTIQLINQFLKQNNVTIPTDDFVEIVSNIYHKYESQQYDSSHYSIELSIPYWQKVLDNLNAKTSRLKMYRVLDFGCGTGFATDQILTSSFKNKCSEIVCYDLSPDMIAVCKTKFKQLDNISFLSNREGFENLKNTTGKFDIIVCNSLIHHILDFKSLFDVFANSLNDDGILIIGHEPNKNFYLNKNLQKTSKIYRIYKRIAIRIKSALGVKKRLKVEDDIRLLTYNELISKGYISRSFPEELIQKFVDIHVPMSILKEQPWGELGFDKTFFKNVSQNNFHVIKQFSYNHIKDEQAYKSLFWRSISKIIQKIYPNDGADAIFVLEKYNSNK